MQGARVTKGDYARLRGVTPGRVSQWIAAKQIHGDALVGEGRSARIDVEIANRQLGVTLDPVQLSAQARPIVDAPDEPVLNDVQRRTLTARAETAEITARQARRREAAEQGIYTLSEEAKRAFAKELAGIMAGLDELMASLADTLAVELKVDSKAATVILRREFRSWRARWSQQAAEEAAEVPALIDEELSPDA